VHQSVRNPDGDEGPRNTGNPHGNTNYSDATDLQALATAQGKDITGKNVITVYFAKAGEVYIDDDPTTPGTTDSMVAQGFEPWEIAAYKYAFAAYEKVADIVYLVVENAYDVVSHTANADFTFLTYAGTAGPGLSLLGRMSPPDTDNEGQSEFNSNDERWTQTGLAPGGFSFTTLIHEMGHGHGLAHPHDNGGSSSVMRGVKPAGIQKDPAPTIPDPVGVWPNYTRGDYSLNQSVFTMMSYQDGWEESPYGQAASTDPFGWLKGLMAFDIAAIQDKYGANESTATGDNVYILEDANHGTLFDSNNNILAFASGFESIWDAGGTDEIRYVGTRDTNIDLRSASLKYEYGGGGWISYAVGIYGGFTIASGVTIENATSGGGNDKLIGNSANNRLDGGGGNDFLNLSAGGNDTALGGGGNDSVYFGSSFTAADSADGGAGRDVLILQGNYTLTFGAASATGFESISLQSGANTRWGDTANNYYDYNITLNDANVAAGQQLIVNGQSLRSGEDLTFDGSAETDGSFLVYGGNGVDILKGGAGNDVFYFEGQRWTSGDKVDGGGGRDAVIISAGNGVTHIEFGPTSLLNIESISLNNRYATDPSQKPSYEIVLNNGNVTPGGTLIVNGSSLATATQFVSIDGSGVHDGNLILFGGAGNDTLRGGDGADSLYGGGGKDNLTGGAGADTFQYRSAGDSTGANADNVLDFQSGADKLDLHLIDANSTADGDQAFQWIGSNAFGGTGAASAGELRVYAQSGTWIVEGDTNGDGTADFSIAVTTQGNAPLVQTDFLL
jgi:serralysin